MELKAWVDKENNRVIFAECDEVFVDVLFSFLTMPMGTIIRLIGDRPPTTPIGCMNNLYGSVQHLEEKRFRTENCKTMLLRPQNGAEAKWKRLKLRIDEEFLPEPMYFACHNPNCTVSKYKLLSYYQNVTCDCGEKMDRAIMNVVDSSALDGGVFVKGLTRFMITDELLVMPASTAASFALCSKIGAMDASASEERKFRIGDDEVKNLLKHSLLSKRPLTETLLQHKAATELSKEDFDQDILAKLRIREYESQADGNISVRLMFSKSKNMVCYAEVSEDFVDLLFSFLTIPLGFIVNEMDGGSSKGCLNHIYESVQELDAQAYLNSNVSKDILLSPKIAPGFGYENQPLGVEEVNQRYYYYEERKQACSPLRLTTGRRLVPSGVSKLTTDRRFIPSGDSVIVSFLTLMDPKSSSNKEAENGGAFVKGPAMFTVTDDLVITPISPVSGLSILNKLTVPFSDIEECDVHVGTKEASRLLVASFVSESALTDVFIRKT